MKHNEISHGAGGVGSRIDELTQSGLAQDSCVVADYSDAYPDENPQLTKRGR